MSKKRTKSQSIGEKGEASFRKFALDNSLLPNKSEYDYGIDFICQLAPDNNLRTATVSSSYLCVNVKSSKAKRLRAKLNNDDLQTALSSDFPLLFVLVGIENDNLYYRFLDNDLLDSFNDRFKRKSDYVLTPKSMSLAQKIDLVFKEQLALFLNKEVQDSLNIKKIKLRLTNRIGQSSLKIIKKENGNFAIIKTSKIENLYSKESPSFSVVRDTFLNYNFAKGAWLPQDALDKEIVAEIRPIASKILMIAPSVSGLAELSIRDRRTKKKAQVEFELRRFHDETSFYHEAGLSIVFSDARKNEEDSLHYHHYDILIKDPNASPVFAHPRLIKFLKSCTENSFLYLSKNAKSGLDISGWTELIRLSKVISGLELVYKELKIIKPLVKLADVNIKKFQYSFGLLEQVVRSKNKTNNILPGFVLVPESVQIEWKKAKIFCPVILLMPEGAIKVEVKSFGKMAFLTDSTPEDVYPVGVQFEKIVSIQAEKIVDDIDIGDFPILPVNGTIALEFNENGLRQIEFPVNEKIAFRLLD